MAGMKRFFVCIMCFVLLIPTLIACATQSASERLNGAWWSDDNFTYVYFDFENGVYMGTGFAGTWKQDLLLIEEKRDSLVFSSQGNLYDIIFQKDASVLLQKRGEPSPAELTRVADELQAEKKQFIEDLAEMEQ
jgi:hypothetical protein